MEVVGGSIPLATTNSPTCCAGSTLRPDSPANRMLVGDYIGLVVVTLLLNLILLK